MPKASEKNLIWIDLEMTGLRPERDRILEVATIVTDSELNVLAEGPVLAVSQPEEILGGMDEWNRTHHGQSGLLARVRSEGVPEAEAEERTVAFLREWVPEGVSPICGNSVGQDRRFLYNYMPTLETFFHYRNLDVSTLKILAMMWYPAAMEGVVKKEAHLALEDIRESIEELRHYREHILVSV
ncbi:MAG: oligoribonuclease [Lentisphaeria bacterium]|nr:oligoribonuclease [Lentisphaeria bacterium]